MPEFSVTWQRGRHAVNGDRTGDYFLMVDGRITAQITCQQLRPGLVGLMVVLIHPSLTEHLHTFLMERVLTQLRSEGSKVHASSPRVVDWLLSHPDYTEMYYQS